MPTMGPTITVLKGQLTGAKTIHADLVKLRHHLGGTHPGGPATLGCS